MSKYTHNEVIRIALKELTKRAELLASDEALTETLQEMINAPAIISFESWELCTEEATEARLLNNVTFQDGRQFECVQICDIYSEFPTVIIVVEEDEVVEYEFIIQPLSVDQIETLGNEVIFKHIPKTQKERSDSILAQLATLIVFEDFDFLKSEYEKVYSSLRNWTKAIAILETKAPDYCGLLDLEKMVDYENQFHSIQREWNYRLNDTPIALWKTGQETYVFLNIKDYTIFRDCGGGGLESWFIDDDLICHPENNDTQDTLTISELLNA